jgi:hypothetical protein
MTTRAPRDQAPIAITIARGWVPGQPLACARDRWGVAGVQGGGRSRTAICERAEPLGPRASRGPSG